MAKTGFYLLDYNPGTRQWTYPRRGAVLSGTIIIHTAECARDDVGEDTSAENCAHFIANRKDYGSYHRLVDSDSIIKMVPWEYEAWQDQMTNPWAVGISSALRTSDWAVMPADRREGYYRNLAECGAEFVRYMRTKGIVVPLKRITGAQARAKVPGFCAHGDSGLNRTDPGRDFNWKLFFLYVQEALDGINPQGGTTKPEEDMPLTPDDIAKVAAAVWDRPILNKYDNHVKAGDLIGYVDKNLNDARAELTAAIASVTVPVVTITEADVAAIADRLKDALGPAVAADLARRLAE